MDPRFQRRIQRYGWDKAAEHYDRYWAVQIEPAQSRLLELADLRPGERVLDVACGTGLVTFAAAEAVGPDGRVIGTDISESMVERLSAAANEQGLGTVSAERMGAEDLRFEDESFDAVLCSLGLMYVPDPVEALRQARRVLRPGGRVVNAVWGEPGKCGWAKIFPIIDSRVKSEVCPLFFQLGTGEALRFSHEAAGFGEITVDRLETVIVYDSPEAACGAAFAGGPVALAYSKFDDVTRQEAHAEYLASIEDYRTSSGYEIPGEFVVARGTKGDGNGAD